MAKMTKNVLSGITIVLCAAASVLALSGCSGSSSRSFAFPATIAEGRAAAQETMAGTGASSISLAFIDGNRVAWAETFGWADRAAGLAPTTETMYPICSMSKMLAAVAAMKLVDQGRVSLDAPLKNYVTSFTMLSPQYAQITVRMLLNHSSGMPGSEYRNAVSSGPLPFSFSAQVLQTLSTERLKTAPGYMSVYCNEGFTLIEQLVPAVAGKTYARFVQDEIFTPLGMGHSRYPLDYFPEGGFAKIHDGAVPEPQLFINDFGSGGLYSTPSDMARVAMMFIGGGQTDGVRVLSDASVAAMGVDQTLASFNPVKSYQLSFGLGWDTVVQPGLRAVGVTGWLKTGDYQGAGTAILVAPAERLAVVVMGESGGFSSNNAVIIAERILLRALVEKGRIGAMPVPLSLAPGATAAPTIARLNAVAGYYARNNALMRVQRQGTLLDFQYYDAAAGTWHDIAIGLRLRQGGTFSTDADPSQSYSFITADGRQYMVLRSPGGYRHYVDDIINGQQIAASGPLPAAWSARLGKKWLMTNENPGSPLKWTVPAFQLTAIDNLLFANNGSLQVEDPTLSDTRAGMMLVIPQSFGKELDDVVIEGRSGEEWIRFGSYLYRPHETVEALAGGAVTIGAEGLSEWRVLDATGTTKTLTAAPVAANGRWRIYDDSLALVQSVTGPKSVSLSNGRYYVVFHDTANVSVP